MLEVEKGGTMLHRHLAPEGAIELVKWDVSLLIFFSKAFLDMQNSNLRLFFLPPSPTLSSRQLAFRISLSLSLLYKALINISFFMTICLEVLLTEIFQTAAV